MGNNSAVMQKTKDEFGEDFRRNKLSSYDTEFSSEIFSSTHTTKTSQEPLYFTFNRRTKKLSNLSDRGCFSDGSSKIYIDNNKITGRSVSFFDVDKNALIPTVFRWMGKPGNVITVSGSFNHWKENVPLTKCDDSTYYTIIDCLPGTHVYKFTIDGTWYHDPLQPCVRNMLGTYDNIMDVKKSDSTVDDALTQDESWCSKRYRHRSTSQLSGTQSPPGEYSRRIPQRIYSDYDLLPPQFPMSLYHSILDTAVSQQTEPSLLPYPQHVKLQHLYASSIKDGLICLSTTIRYRSKYVTIIMHKSV